ncbi:MAG: hypothetical protein SGPRY_010259 [Prymnesium sp.]
MWRLLGAALTLALTSYFFCSRLKRLALTTRLSLLRFSLERVEQLLLSDNCPICLLATWPTAVSDRPWYSQLLLTDLSAACGCRQGQERLLGVHLGSEHNPPESLVLQRWEEGGREEGGREGGRWEVVAEVLLKRYAQFSLLAFAWIPRFREGSRALLLGLGGGSLVHYWMKCVPGGEEIYVDAVEIDGAMVKLARQYLGFGSCEVGGRAHVHQADALDFLLSVEEESYDLIFCDLDMGMLLPEQDESRRASDANPNTDPD